MVIELDGVCLLKKKHHMINEEVNKLPFLRYTSCSFLELHYGNLCLTWRTTEATEMQNSDDMASCFHLQLVILNLKCIKCCGHLVCLQQVKLQFLPFNLECTCQEFSCCDC